MGRTLTQLVQGVGRKLTPKYRYITNAGTGGSGTWTDATNLADMPADWFAGLWLYHVTDAKEWRISASTTGGQLTVNPTTTPTSTSDYELLPCRPSLIVDAINDIAERHTDIFGRTRLDNSYVTDSPIFNAGFEDTTSSTAITGWQASTVTMTRESGAANKLGGAYSVALTAANGYIEPTTEFQNLLMDGRGLSITLYVPCKTSTASTARIGLVLDGTATYSTYHIGGGGWETLEVTASIPDPVDTTTIRLYRDAGGTIYYDNAWIEGFPRMYYYRMPAPLFAGPSVIAIQNISDRDMMHQLRPYRTWSGWTFVREEDPAVTTTRNVLYVTSPPRGGRWLMWAWEPLNPLSARTDVAEIDIDRAELLEVKAAILLLEEFGVIEGRMRLSDLKTQERELRSHLTETLGAAQLSVR